MGKKKEKAVVETEISESAEPVAKQTEAVEEQAVSVAEEKEVVLGETQTEIVTEPVQEKVETEKKGKKAKKVKAKKEKKPVHPLTVTAFITSIVFLVFHGALGAPIISIVLAIVGLVKGKKKGMGGAVFGVVAIVLSAIALLISSGNILFVLLKTLYIIWMLIQSVISIITKFHFDVFEFLGRALQIIVGFLESLAFHAEYILHFNTFYGSLNDMMTDGALSDFLQKFANFLIEVM